MGIGKSLFLGASLFAASFLSSCVNKSADAVDAGKYFLERSGKPVIEREVVGSDTYVFDMPERFVVEKNVSPIMTISEDMKTVNVLPKRSEVVNNRVRFDVNASYSIPKGFSFDPISRVLESDLTENGKFGYEIGAGFGKRDHDFWFLSKNDSPAHYVLNYFDDFEMTGDDFLTEGKKLLAGGKVKDFDVSGMTLEELAGMGKRLDEFSKISSGDGFWKYVVDLPAEGKWDGKVVFESEVVRSDGSRLDVVNGLFGSAEVEARAYFEAGANWDLDGLNAGADLDGSFYNKCNVESGFFVEGKVTSPDGVFLGAGAIGKEGESEARLERYFGNVNANVFDLSAGLEYAEQRIKEKMEEKEDVLYLTGGFDDEGWVSSSVGVRLNKREGFQKVSEDGQRFDLGLGGLEEKSLDSVLQEDVDERSAELIYGIAGGKNILNADSFDVDVHGYFKNYPSSESGAGFSLRSDLVNMVVESDGYFIAGKLFGDGGNFKEGFKDRAEKRASFLEEYVTGNSLWEGKKGLYGYVEKVGDVDRLGGAACFDDFYVSAAGVQEGNMKGAAVDIGGDKVRFSAEYVKSDVSERAGLSGEFKVADNCYVVGSGSRDDGENAGVVEVKFSF